MNLLETVSHTLARLTGRSSAHQRLDFTPQPHYYYLASFPKSGNTWVRFLLANIIADTDIGLRQFGKYVPDSHIAGDITFMSDPATPFNQAPRQFVKTHYRYQPAFQHVIYVARDGRDALTSYYHWINARSQKPVSLHDIIVGNTVWGLWSDHVTGWLNGRCHRLVVKYEDLFSDTPGQLRAMLDFAALKAGPEQIAHAVHAASFDNMRNLEKDLRGDEGKPAVEAAPGAKEKIMFVRKGGSGDWQNLFSPADEALFWKHHRAGMEAVGYTQ